MNLFQTYLSYGLSVLPCKGKIPAISAWKALMETPATQEQAAAWSGNIAIICGYAGAHCIDFDVKYGDKSGSWFKIMADINPEIYPKLVMEKTPSGGLHIIYKTKSQTSNLKLALNKNGEATIETRGNGGYFVCAPSEGYSLLQGNYGGLSELTEDEHNACLNIAKSLNEYSDEKAEPKIPQSVSVEARTPLDDYDARTTGSDVISILESAGWSIYSARGNRAALRRPGKEGRGLSATWNVVPDRLYVFSSNAKPFEAGEIYKKSAVYAYLNHGGNFSAAAKELSAKGYGKKDQVRSVSIVNVSEIEKKLKEIHEVGYPQGKTTGWSNLDAIYSVHKGQFTVVIGIPSHGKSEFLDALTMNLAIKSSWNFVVFSPENYPPEIHYHKLIEKYIKKPFFGQERMPFDEAKKGLDFINKHFTFIDASEEDVTLESVLTTAEKIIVEKKCDGFIIDPWNEIELNRPKDGISDTEYIGICLRKIRKFARRLNIHLWVAVHPTKMQKNKDTGEYEAPDLYDAQGSSHWRNKADNGLCVYRDFGKQVTTITALKIKYRWAGTIGGKAILRFNSFTTQFEE